MRMLILSVVGLFALFGMLPMAASSSTAQSAVDYETFMKQDRRSRIRTFNQITPENRSELVRTQIERWIETNKSRLTSVQMNVMNENLAFVSPDRYRQPMNSEDMVRAKDLEARTAAVFSPDDMRQALTVHGDYIPKEE